ncbi:MAG: hypothetical protein IJ882_05230 [Paludibacteraceae bacterium]|nr:hypothetical protein [Paludibacteraceae bacterium]
MRKLLLLAVSLLLTVTTIYAERVSQEDAALVATNFMRYGAAQSGVRKATGAKMVLKKAANNKPYKILYNYKINYSDSGNDVEIIHS